MDELTIQELEELHNRTGIDFPISNGHVCHE